MQCHASFARIVGADTPAITAAIVKYVSPAGDSGGHVAAFPDHQATGST